MDQMVRMRFREPCSGQISSESVWILKLESANFMHRSTAADDIDDKLTPLQFSIPFYSRSTQKSQKPFNFPVVVLRRVGRVTQCNRKLISAQKNDFSVYKIHEYY